MTKSDIAYAVGIVLFVGLVGFALNQRQDSITSNVVLENNIEKISCIFQTPNTCYVHFNSKVFSCYGKQCSITLQGVGSAIVTSSCGDEFSSQIEGREEIFMFNC